MCGFGKVLHRHCPSQGSEGFNSVQNNFANVFSQILYEAAQGLQKWRVLIQPPATVVNGFFRKVLSVAKDALENEPKIIIVKVYALCTVSSGKPGGAVRLPLQKNHPGEAS